MRNLYIHPSSEVFSSSIGDGTNIWQYCIVLSGAVIGNDCNVNSHCFVENDVLIGDRVTLKCGVYVWDGLIIDDDVFIGPNVTFSNDKRPRSKCHGVIEKTHICKGASIGAGAILLPGVVIGEYSLIGAGSVVTKSVPAYSLVMGNPAKFVSYICKCGNKISMPKKCEVCGFELSEKCSSHF
jgi:acetyltransferase-like isoleucine patch superfamily enzyme